MSKNYREESLKKHKEWGGKISTELKMPLETKDDLSLAYTPGVAEACLAIHEDESLAYDYTWKNNTVAVVSDGTAVLGLGDIGPKAAMPVMEGKCALFKRFGGVNAVPICLDTKDTEEIIQAVKLIAPGFGGINLEDISAPRCIEIERRLIEELDIPVFHDDQHGTAIVTTAGLINALKLVGKKPEDCTAVVSGVGAAGSSIIRMIRRLGIKEIYGFCSKGVLRRSKSYDNPLYVELSKITNSQDKDLDMASALEEADIFIGVSAPGIVSLEMAKKMKKDAIIFAMANPVPEISYEDAVASGAAVVGTGRSDYPNQINNVLAFPGLFRGALQVRARKITEEMKYQAAIGLAGMIPEEELRPDHIIVNAFDPGVAECVAKAVAEQAVEEGIHGHEN